MSSTKATSLFLVLISYHIMTMRNVLAEDPFTYEDLMEFKGVDFCVKKNSTFFKAMCTHLAKVNDIALYEPMEYDTTCLNQQLEIATKANTIERPEIPSISCTFNADIEGYNKEAPTIYRILGKGQLINDIAEYSLPDGTDEMNWRPVKVHSKFLEGLVPFTYEELMNDFTGENFCLRKHKKLYKAMCAHLGKVNNIKYESIQIKTNCENNPAEMWSSEEKTYKHAEIPLLYCIFRYTNLPPIPKAIGIGRLRNDIAEYSFLYKTEEGINHWEPVKVHSDFLDGLLPFTYEELMNDFKGEDFCLRKDEKLSNAMCGHLVKVSNIEQYDRIDVATYCENKPAKLWSSEEKAYKQLEIPLLHCIFGFSNLPTISKALGIGRRGNDIAEYSSLHNETGGIDIWEPIEVHSDFLDGLLPFTYEEMKNDFIGENFCLKKDKKLFNAMCTHLAKVNDIGQYKTITGNTSCNVLPAELWSSEEKRYRHPKFSLLLCQFNMKENSKPIKAGLGVGRWGNDIAEYSFSPDIYGWEPVKVHSDFLYGLVLFTYEELMNGFEGDDFCAENDPKLFKAIAMCNRLGKVKETEQLKLKTTGSGDSCIYQSAEFWSSKEKKNTQTKIPLLLCKLNFMTINNEGKKFISMYRALGKGRQINDVAEYSLPHGTLEPYWRPVAEYSNFLNTV